MRRQLLGLGFAAASSLLALHAAHALTAPQPITIDGGPLGDLQISGGVDGYGYVMSNTPNGVQSNGFNISSGILNIQKTTGIVQFTIELGANSFQVLGAEAYGTYNPDGSPRGHIAQASVNQYPTGPLYEGYITIAPPNSPVTVSAGFLPSVEGWEYGADYYNAVQLETLLYYVQNNNARGVEATLTEGPFSATVQFGDSEDSGVWNTLQALLTYKFNANNALSVYGAYNLGKTGPNTYLFALPKSTTLGYSNSPYANNALIGAYYNYTIGNLNLVPEVQYQYARPNREVGIVGESHNIGAAVFADYTFANTPYSLGGWIEYFNSHSAAKTIAQNSTGDASAATPYSWAIGPNVEAIGAAIAPTWQYKYLFARANAGYIYLLHTKNYTGFPNSGYDGSHGQFTGTLEAGLLF